MNANFRNGQVHLSVPLKHSLHMCLKSEVLLGTFHVISAIIGGILHRIFPVTVGFFTHRTD